MTDMNIPEIYQEKKLVHYWPYEFNGVPVGATARYEDKDGKVVIPFFGRNGEGFYQGAAAEPRPLFGLDLLIGTKVNRSILITEGEKCAKALQDLCFIAVTSSGGSNAANKTDWKPVEGRRRVYILPDNDEPGEHYAKDITSILGEFKTPPEVFIVELPDLPEKGDVVDWLKLKLPEWNGYSNIPEGERQHLTTQLQDAINQYSKRVPTEWLTGEPIEWNEPSEIEACLRPVPELPIEQLPVPFRAWVQDTTHRMQTPMDFAAITAMVVTASVIGAGCGVRPKQKDDWQVIPNLWGACIGRPSVVLKSPSMKEPLNMLEKLQTEANEVHKEELKDYEFDVKVNESQQKELEKEITKATKAKDNTMLEGLRRDYTEAEELQKPIGQLFKTNETSVQSQTVLQNQNPRGLLTFRDELTGQLTRWDKQEHAEERAYFLEGWNGDSPYTDVKIGRGVTHADSITISLLGGIQPDKLKRYLFKTMYGGNDGLVQRFQLAVYPDEPKDWKLIDEYPDTKAKNRAFEVLKKLAHMDFTKYGAVKEDDNTPYLRFTPEAQLVFNQWLTELQASLQTEENSLMVEHLGKYRSLMPSLALIFHLVQVADGTAEGQVSKQAVLEAESWCMYLEEHARRIYGIVTSPEREAGSILAEHIRNGKLPNPFTAKDVYRKGWQLLQDRDEVEAACSILEDENWLKKERVKSKTGRPPLPNYWINPKVNEN